MKKYKLGDILELQRGYDLPHSEMEEGNVPVAGSSGIIGYHSISKIDPPCITIGRSGSVGKLFFYNEAIWPHNTSLYIKSFKNNNEKYIFYLLKTVDFERLCDSSVVPSLNRNFVYPIKVPFYDNIADQQKIAAVLSSLDDKIALNNRINAKLEQMAKRLYDYWFVQFDFPVPCHSELVSESHNKEMLNQVQHDECAKPYKSTGGKMVWNEELKREIPERWEVVKFKDVITHINTGLNPRDNFSLGNGNIKYITVKNLTEKGEIDFSNCDLIDEDARELVHNRSEIEKGDILFASICPLGRCYLITSEPENWDINESVFSIRPNYSNVTSVFLYAVLRDPYYVKKMTQKATGSIFKGIRIDDIEKIELVLPEKNIIDLYTEKVKSIINKQALLQEENLKLTAMRDKLLLLLMNGQVVVE